MDKSFVKSDSAWLKIYKELNCQNGIIFDAERERNALELERDSLKGIAKLTKKEKLQNKVGWERFLFATAGCQKEL